MEIYRFHSDGSVFFVTFSVVDWLPVFVSDTTCRILTDSRTFCHQEKGLCVNGFVIMPTHFHAIVFHMSFRSEQLESVITDFRKFTGRQLCDHFQHQGPPCFSATIQTLAGKDRRRRFWQPSRHPVQIETEKFWQTKLAYLHENPCRKGLVSRAEHWRYSSAAYWLENGPCDVPLSCIEW